MAGRKLSNAVTVGMEGDSAIVLGRSALVFGMGTWAATAGVSETVDAASEALKLTSRRDAIGVLLSCRSRRGGIAETRLSARRGVERLRRNTRLHHDGREESIARCQ